MILLIQLIMSELRQAILDKLVGDLVGELSNRDVQMMIMGAILTLLIIEVL